MDGSQADAYLHRIGAPRPSRPDAAALRDLHLRHLRTVPFENLSIHLGEAISLDEKSLHDKLVGAHRGGFCYELNGAFAALLAALGYPVTLHAARAFTPGGLLGPPFDHLALRVQADGRPWLADVGFGRHTHYPLPFTPDADHPDPGGSFRLVATPEGDLDVLRDGRPQYRVDPRPRALPDFEATCWWQQTSPKSHFTQSLVCSLLAADGGRVTLSGCTLVTTNAAGTRDELELESDAAVLTAYRDLFGITLDRVPQPRR